jgi:hypothetical protein
MDIHQDELSRDALRYKQICHLDDPLIRVEMNRIFRKIKQKFIGVLRNKQRELPLRDQKLIESQFDGFILYALTKWKAKSPFGGYLSVCFKGIIRQYCKEISPVNRSEFTKSVSYDKIVDFIYEYEDNIDIDDVGLLNEDIELGITRDILGGEMIDYSEIDDEFEKWKLD